MTTRGKSLAETLGAGEQISPAEGLLGVISDYKALNGYVRMGTAGGRHLRAPCPLMGVGPEPPAGTDLEELAAPVLMFSRNGDACRYLLSFLNS